MRYKIDAKTGYSVPVVERSKFTELDLSKENFKVETGLYDLRKCSLNEDCESSMPVAEFNKRCGFPSNLSPDYVVAVAMRGGHVIAHRDGRYVISQGTMSKSVLQRAIEQRKAWERGVPYTEKKKVAKRSAVAVEYR